MNIRTFLFLMAIALVAGPARAGTLEDGDLAFGLQDYVTAMRLLKPLAEGGDARAEVMVGSMYAWGVGGVEKNPTEAIKWWHESAKQGDFSAQDALGNSYRTGFGVPQDDVRAYMWLSLAKTGLGGSGSPSFKMVEEKMSPQQIAQAQVLARKCFGSHYTDCGLRKP